MTSSEHRFPDTGFPDTGFPDARFPDNGCHEAIVHDNGNCWLGKLVPSHLSQPARWVGHSALVSGGGKRTEGESGGDQGFALVGLIVAIFLILLALSVAAPKVAQELRREREVETVRRGNQYVRAIRVYYRKLGHYPGSMEQLEKTNNIRFLRQQYVDPMTGKADWRLIKVGQAKTTVKGFFGKPLAGLAASWGMGSSLGSSSLTSSPMGINAQGSNAPGSSAFGSSAPGSSSQSASSPGPGFGGQNGPGFGSSSGPGFGGSGSGGPGTAQGGGGGGGTATDSSGVGSTSGVGSLPAGDLKGGGGPFVGVGLVREGDSILTLNEQTTYLTWEFIYDPRIEQMSAKTSALGGALGSRDASTLGATPPGSSGLPGLGGTPPAGSTTPSNPSSSTPP